MIQQTLIIFKPDCMAKNLMGQVLARFEKEGFKLAACKMTVLTDALLRQHYSHIADKPFFPSVAGFMSSRPVVVAVLQGDNIIARVRDLLGPTDSQAAPKGTIRGDLGQDKMNNICHASDGPEAAADEIARFFAKGEVFSL